MSTEKLHFTQEFLHDRFETLVLICANCEIKIETLKGHEDIAICPLCAQKSHLITLWEFDTRKKFALIEEIDKSLLQLEMLLVHAKARTNDSRLVSFLNFRLSVLDTLRGKVCIR